MESMRKLLCAATIFLTIVTFAGCHKKTARVTQPPPAPAPAPPMPTAELHANPVTIQQGQSTTLTWQTQNATTITLRGIGTVSASGSRTMTPASSTDYTLVAQGAGGTKEASTRVTVNPVVAKAPPPIDLNALFAQNIHDVLFDFDKYNVRPDQTSATQADARFLREHPDLKILLEGHCDDRGSEEYNLVLGDSRANAVKQALVTAGVQADRIQTITYGKDKPFCAQDNESCWQENRRDHFVHQN